MYAEEGVTALVQGVDYQGSAREDFSTDFKQPESPSNWLPALYEDLKT